MVDQGRADQKVDAPIGLPQPSDILIRGMDQNVGVGQHTIEVNVADPDDPTAARGTREGVQTLTILPSTSSEPLSLMFHFE